MFGASLHNRDPSDRVAFFTNQQAFKLKEEGRLWTGEDMQGVSSCKRRFFDASGRNQFSDILNKVEHLHDNR
jgi:hypothetical protein